MTEKSMLEEVGGRNGLEAPQKADTGGFFVRLSKQFVAGTVGGLAECIAAYPLDTVKTRMQTARAGSFGGGGAVQCFTTAVREDGALALYRGMSSRLVASGIAASVLFSANGTLREILGADAGQPLSGRFVLAAAGTGVVEAIAYCPLELIKTRMQVVRGSPEGVTVWSTGLRIYRQHGIKGCYKGFSSMILKDGLGNSVYFGSYELCKQALTCGSGTGSGRTRRREGGGEDDSPGVWPVVAAGGCAGVLYTVATHPMDTVKSLVQTDSIEAPRYRGFVDGWREALARGRSGAGGRIQGIMGLYRGLSPAVARAFVGNSILFSTYEKVLDALGR